MRQQRAWLVPFRSCSMVVLTRSYKDRERLMRWKGPHVAFRRLCFMAHMTLSSLPSMVTKPYSNGCRLTIWRQTVRIKQSFNVLAVRQPDRYRVDMHTLFSAGLIARGMKSRSIGKSRAWDMHG